MVIFARARARFISSRLRVERDVDVCIVFEEALAILFDLSLLDRSPFLPLVRFFGGGNILREGNIVAGMLL